jgi:phage FluMu protein Com
MAILTDNNCLEQIRKRRKAFFLSFPIILFSIIIIILFFQQVLGTAPKWLMFILTTIANGISCFMFIRISSVRCPKCGKSLLKAGRLPFSLKNLKCCHCDHVVKQHANIKHQKP